MYAQNLFDSFDELVCHVKFSKKQWECLHRDDEAKFGAEEAQERIGEIFFVTMFAFLTPDGLCVAVDVLVIVTDSALLWRNVGWEFSGHSPGDVPVSAHYVLKSVNFNKHEIEPPKKKMVLQARR